MSDGVEQSANSLSVADVVIVVAGVVLFAAWLLNTSLGRRALDNSKPRRHRMAPFTPVVLFLAWTLGVGLLQTITLEVTKGIARWRVLFLTQLVYFVVSLGTVGVIVAWAKLDFARGLKGLGLRIKTVPRDLVFAFLNLWAVQPLVLAAMSLTMLVMKGLHGREYQIPQHEALKLITESAAVPLQVLLVITAVVVAPIVEETLFRGLFQTVLRSYLRRPWPAIVITSALFALIHADFTHWPSLFMLALGLGYAYEKSGSLLRPIFMHALFNGTTVAIVLTQGPGWIQ